MNKKIKSFVKKILISNFLLKYFYQKYFNKKLKKNIQKKNELFKENGLLTFKELGKILNDNNIKYWLCYGTLLGYVRENGLLKHDFDFDIGIWASDYSHNLENILVSAGFNLAHQFISEGDYKAFEQTYEKNGVSIDVFYHYSNDEKIWTHVFYRELEDEDLVKKGLYRIRKLDYPKASLEKIVFLDTDAYIPSNKEQYLCEIYGENWKIPDPNYDWHKGPKNNCTVSNIYGKYYRFN